MSHDRFSSPGSLPMLAAMRRASSGVSLRSAFRRLRPGGQEKEPEALYALKVPECLNLGF